MSEDPSDSEIRAIADVYRRHDFIVKTVDAPTWAGEFIRLHPESAGNRDDLVRFVTSALLTGFHYGSKVSKSDASEAETARDALTFDHFRRANVTRCLKWHPEGIESWSPSDWLTALAGELGELASLLKMRNRERDGLPGNKFSPTDKMVADELADVLTYLDLLAAALGVDLGRAAVSKFNEVSERVGFPDRIVLGAGGTSPTRSEE